MRQQKIESNVRIKEVTNGVFRRMGAITIIAAIMLIVTLPVSADECKDNRAEQVYDASNGLKPNETGTLPLWNKKCGGTEGFGSFATVDGDVLKVRDIFDPFHGDRRASYCITGLFIDTCNPRQDSVYEIAFFTNSESGATSWPTVDLNFICGLRDGLNDTRIAIARNEIGFFDYDITLKVWDWLVVDDVPQVVLHDTRNDTVVRVEKDDTEVRLYIDNESSASLTVDLDKLSNAANDNRADLLVTSTPGLASFDLYMMRYRLGTTNLEGGSSSCEDADFDDDGDVDTEDLLTLFANWGPCSPSPATCPWDLNSDGTVNTEDLLDLFASWGPCP